MHTRGRVNSSLSRTQSLSGGKRSLRLLNSDRSCLLLSEGVGSQWSSWGLGQGPTQACLRTACVGVSQPRLQVNSGIALTVLEYRCSVVCSCSRSREVLNVPFSQITWLLSSNEELTWPSNPFQGACHPCSTLLIELILSSLAIVSQL